MPKKRKQSKQSKIKEHCALPTDLMFEKSEIKKQDENKTYKKKSLDCKLSPFPSTRGRGLVHDLLQGHTHHK